MLLPLTLKINQNCPESMLHLRKSLFRDFFLFFCVLKYSATEYRKSKTLGGRLQGKIVDFMRAECLIFRLSYFLVNCLNGKAEHLPAVAIFVLLAAVGFPPGCSNSRLAGISIRVVNQLRVQPSPPISTAERTEQKTTTHKQRNEQKQTTPTNR